MITKIVQCCLNLRKKQCFVTNSRETIQLIVGDKQCDNFCFKGKIFFKLYKTMQYSMLYNNKRNKSWVSKLVYQLHINFRKIPTISIHIQAFQQAYIFNIGKSKQVYFLFKSQLLLLLTSLNTVIHHCQNPEKKDFHMKLVNLYSPNDKALSLNALPAVQLLQQSFTELGI